MLTSGVVYGFVEARRQPLKGRVRDVGKDDIEVRAGERRQQREASRTKSTRRREPHPAVSLPDPRACATSFGYRAATEHGLDGDEVGAEVIEAVGSGPPKGVQGHDTSSDDHDRVGGWLLATDGQQARHVINGNGDSRLRVGLSLEARA